MHRFLSIQATVCLGALHYHGIAGIERNPRKAFELYNLAAEGGN
jgi:TPR repeat protein